MADDWEILADKESGVLPSKIPPNANKWEGEDEDDDVKDSWEDEEEKKDEEKVKEEINLTSKSKPKKVIQAKLIEKDQIELENTIDEEKLGSMTPEEKLVEKLRLQKIQEEEDLKTALDTFGVPDNSSGIDAMNPTNKVEFLALAQAIIKKISLYKNSEEFYGFIEELVRSSCAHLSAADIKKIKITVDNLHVEKQKFEKEKTKKTSGKTKTKVKLRVEEDNVRSNNIGDYEYGYDGYDYDDFM